MLNILCIFILWSIIGFGVWLVVAMNIQSKSLHGRNKGVLCKTSRFEFLDPRYIYKYNRVNYFGAAMVCLLYNLICPLMSIIYWFYKLCTVGRSVDK